jgi:hypothetical protein
MDFCRCFEKAEKGGGKIAAARCELGLLSWILDILSQPQKTLRDEAIIPSKREEGSITGSSSHTGTLLAPKPMTSHTIYCAFALLDSD